MLDILNPEYRFSSLGKIRPEWLQRRGYRALLVDVDNTFLPRNSCVVPANHLKWLSEMRRHEFLVALISNNGGKRIAQIRKQLEQEGLSVPVLTWAGKPLPRAFAGAIRLLDGSDAAAGVLTVGDQLFTDVLGAHLYDLPAAWVSPLSSGDFIGTKLVRIAEGWVAGYLRRAGVLPEEDAESRDWI